MSDRPLGDPLAGPTYKGFATAPERPQATPGRAPRRRAAWAGAGVLGAALAAAAGLSLHRPGAAPQPEPARPALAAVSTAAAARPSSATLPTPPAGAPAAAVATPAAAEAQDLAAPPTPRAPEARRRPPRPGGARDGCGRQGASIAQILCRDPQVAGLDRQVNAAFAQAMRDSAAPGQLASEQENWIVRRDRTAREDPESVPDLYRERIAVLQAQAGPAPSD